MSNTDNIYNILNNFNKIAKEEPAPVATPKAKTKLQESMEQIVNEKYMGFKKTVAAIKKGGGAEDPEAVAAAIGRKKHGKEKFQKAAATGKKLGEGQSVSEEQQDESALQAHIGKKKHGKPYMTAASLLMRNGGSQEELGALRDKLSKAHKGKIKNEDHGPENPDAPVNYGEYDREGDMAKDDLYTIDSAAEELYSILQADENLPEWVQSKITKAVDYIDTARDYMKAQSYGQGVAEGSGDPQIPIGMKTQYGTVVSVNVKENTVTVKASNGELTTVNIQDIDQAMAEGDDDKFRAADKVVGLVRYYKLHRARDWFDLFEKIAGKKFYGTEMIREIDRANEYASKFLDLIDSIGMRYEYRGRNRYNPQNDQELIDLSNQFLDLLDQAENEFKAMSGQGMAEGSSENKYSNLSNRGVNRGINRAGDDFNRMMDLDQAESPHYKTQHQQNTKQRLKTKPMVGPKGVLPEQDVTEGPALSTSTLTGEIPTLMGLRKKEQGDLIEKYALYNREKDYFELFVELSGKPMSEIYNMNDSHQLAYELYNLGSQIASDWRNISNPKFSRREYLNQIMSDWYNLFKKSIQKYKSMKQGVAEGEDSKEIGPGWKTEHGIVDQVDGNSVIVKTSQGKMRVNITDIKTAEAPEQGMSEARFPTVADAQKRAEQEKGTGKFTSKKNPDNPSGTFYTRKYNPKSGESDDTENVTAVTRGRGRPKKSAFEDMSTIDKMIAESFGELFEGTSRPVGDPVSKAAPTAPGVGSGIRVTPMPALATTPKPAIGMGTIKGGVFTATPPKPGEQGVAIPQGLDEVDAEMEGMRKLAGLKGNDGNLANNAKPYKKVTRRDVIQGAQDKDEMGGKEHDLEEGGRDDYDKIRDKIQWLQGAPNYLSRDEAKETAYYTKDTDPVWADYSDDADEVGENLEVRANPAGASSAEQAKKIGAQFPQQNGKEPNLAYKIGEDEMDEGYYKDPDGDDESAEDNEDKKDNEKRRREEDEMDEGNVVTGAMADKTIPVGAPIPGTNLKKTKHLDTIAEGDAALNQMRRIAGLKEGGMSPIGGMAADMEKQQGSMNISTNQSSDGTKSVTITAAGDAASDLMQMLKLAGMGGGAAPAAAAEPEIVVVAQDGEETMEEEKDPRYQASTTPDEQVAPVQALTKGGNGDVAGQEKTMKPGGYQFGDNNLAMQESLSTQLMKEYNSIKVKK